MEQVIERACGPDVHTKTVVACVRLPGARGALTQHVRTFGTTAAELGAGSFGVDCQWRTLEW